MKNRIIFLFFFIIFVFPLSSFAAPEKSFNRIIKLINEKEYVSADKLLNQFLTEYPDGIWRYRALYMKGNVNVKLSRLENAVENFSRLLSRYSQLKDYTQLKLAEVYLELEKEDKSFELVNHLIKEFPQSRLKPQAKFLLGKLHFNRGDLDDAIKVFSEIIKKYPKSDLAPESMFWVGMILEKQKKTIIAYETYVKLFHTFPVNEFAAKAEKRIKEIKKTKTKLPKFSQKMISRRIELLMKEGKYEVVLRECKAYLKIYKQGVFYQNLTLKLVDTYLFQKKRQEALKFLKSLIKKYPSSSITPEALYKVANIYWNLGKYSKAIQYCKKTISKFPSSSFAEKAFYAMGQILAQNKKYQEAISQFQKMVNSYPHGAFVASANWRIGWINFISGNYRKAADVFSEAASKYSESPIRDMLLYWAGKSNEKTEKTESAVRYYQQVAEEYPYTYYGHRGKAKLTKKSGNKVKIIDPFFQRVLKIAPVYAEKEIGLSSAERFHYMRVKELIATGFYKDALKEIRLIARNVSVNTPGKILWSGNLYLRAEGYFKSVEIMEGFLSELSYKKKSSLHVEYWKLLFPLAYLEAVADNARGFQLDPFLLEGLIRQESIFDPDSLSRSGAIGLMQLMPKTGKYEYIKKYKDKFHLEKLYIPEINISLGSQHLAYLFKKTKGDPVLALAGYNAGLSRALKWKKTLNSSDMDVFIEMIPYRETKMYVKKVLRNYFNYITLYGDEEEKDKTLALNAKDL